MISPANQDQCPSGGIWASISHYAAPPFAAAAAIIPLFRELVAKSSLQKGLSIPKMTLVEGLMGGLKAAPTIGCIIGGEMALQPIVEKVLASEEYRDTLIVKLTSSAIVGTASAPAIAILNGQTMGFCLRTSLKKFSLRQGFAIAIRETAFVLGLSASSPLSNEMKEKWGNNKIVDYSASFITGALGSLAGHPADTALTRWQSGLPVKNFRQSWWGAARRARAIGLFSVTYKLGKELLI